MYLVLRNSVFTFLPGLLIAFSPVAEAREVYNSNRGAKSEVRWHMDYKLPKGTTLRDAIKYEIPLAEYNAQTFAYGCAELCGELPLQDLCIAAWNTSSVDLKCSQHRDWSTGEKLRSCRARKAYRVLVLNQRTGVHQLHMGALDGALTLPAVAGRKMVKEGSLSELALVEKSLEEAVKAIPNCQ